MYRLICGMEQKPLTKKNRKDRTQLERRQRAALNNHPEIKTFVPMHNQDILTAMGELEGPVVEYLKMKVISEYEM